MYKKGLKTLESKWRWVEVHWFSGHIIDKKKWWKTQLFDKYEAILLIFQWWVERMQENNVEIDKEYTHTWASIHFNVKVMKAGVT